MTVCFITFGCKVNLCETENMKVLFEEEGFEISEKSGDVFVINSCTVTAESDRKMRRKIAAIKAHYPQSAIVLTGCFPQAFPDEAKKNGADVIIGAENRASAAALTKRFFSENKRIFAVQPYKSGEKFELLEPSGFSGKTRGFIKIQDGCNRFCTYCIIPYSRGRIRSKPLVDVVSEAQRLSADGHREIVLTGINLTFYGAEIGKTLADAVEAVCSVDGVDRVRLSSLEPEMLTDEVIERLSAQKKLCPHFHLSVQSGCDKTLREMGRKYTSAEYEHIVNLLRNKFTDCAITTDIMVGFPNESVNDFQESLQFCKKIGFNKMHIFPYSVRKGTPAADYPNQVSPAEKTERARLMADADKENSKKRLDEMLGKTVKVLFERENSPEFHQGHAENYTLIKIPAKIGEKSLRRKIFCVKIERSGQDCCYGNIVGEEE